MRNLLTISILTALASVAVPAGANAAPTDRAQVAINFDRTAALTASGRAALDRRIHRAAATVCDTGTGALIIDAHCVAQAQSRASSDLDVRLAAIASPVQLASK